MSAERTDPETLLGGVVVFETGPTAPIQGLALELGRLEMFDPGCRRLGQRCSDR